MTPGIPEERPARSLPPPLVPRTPPVSQSFPGTPFLPPETPAIKLVSSAEDAEFHYLYGEYPLSARAECDIENFGVEILILEDQGGNVTQPHEYERLLTVIQRFSFPLGIDTTPVEYVTNNGIIKIILKMAVFYLVESFSVHDYQSPIQQTFCTPRFLMIPSNTHRQKRQSPEGSGELSMAPGCENAYVACQSAQ